MNINLTHQQAKALIKNNQIDFIEMVMLKIQHFFYFMNNKNQLFGQKIYHEMLGHRPNIATVNEMAFSGLCKHA